MARLFDQTNPDRIEVGDVPSVDIDGDQMTVSIWLKVDSLNGEQKFFSKWADVGGKFQYLLSSTAGDKLQFVINNGSQRVALGSTTTPTGGWIHVAGRYNGSNVRVYLNGVQDGTLNTSGNIINTDAPLVLGAGSSGAGSEQPLDGELGHCALWDAALSADEIKSLAAGVSPLKIHKNNNLVFYAPLNGQSPELDVIEGLDLTLVGTTKAEEPPIPNSIVAP